MEQPRTSLMLCGNCNSSWTVIQLDSDDWRLIGTKVVSSMEPQEPTPEQVFHAVLSGEMETIWAASNVIETFREAATQPICPHCGHDLRETFLWFQIDKGIVF